MQAGNITVGLLEFKLESRLRLGDDVWAQAVLHGIKDGASPTLSNPRSVQE